MNLFNSCEPRRDRDAGRNSHNYKGEGQRSGSSCSTEQSLLLKNETYQRSQHTLQSDKLWKKIEIKIIKTIMNIEMFSCV